jgi:hypothetical protein
VMQTDPTQLGVQLKKIANIFHNCTNLFMPNIFSVCKNQTNGCYSRLCAHGPTILRFGAHNRYVGISTLCILIINQFTFGVGLGLGLDMSENGLDITGTFQCAHGPTILRGSWGHSLHFEVKSVRFWPWTWSWT